MYEALIEGVDRLITTLCDLESTQATDVVEVGRHITIEFDDGGQEEYLLLDTQGGVDLGDYQTLSVVSPVGKAVIGARIGQTVKIELPNAEILIKIVSLK